MNRNQILFITEFFPPDYAPTGELIRQLSIDLSINGLNIEVFTQKPGYAFKSQNSQIPSQEDSEGFVVKRSNLVGFVSKRIRFKIIASLVFALRSFLYLLIHTHKKDLIILTTAPAFLPFVGAVNNLLFGKPFVCIIYDLYPDILTALNLLPDNHWIIKLWRKINNYTWNKASHLIVLDSSMKRKILTIDPQMKNKISIISNWAEDNVIVPIAKQDNWFAQKYNLVDKFTVIYSGNIGRCHDIDTIIEAIFYLKAKPIQFVFIGNGAKSEFILQKIDELELNNILMLPYQDSTTIPYSLTAGDLYLISIDKNMDGLISPCKTYSSLAAGRPIAVICPEQSFFNSLVTTGECGKCFQNGESQKLADFILYLSQNPELYKKMGKASREYFLSNFERKISTQTYYSLIKSIISKEGLSQKF